MVDDVGDQKLPHPGRGEFMTATDPAPDVAEEIEELLFSVREQARNGDDECAHIAADKLLIRALEIIASMGGLAAQVARHALEVEEIEFKRMCA